PLYQLLGGKVRDRIPIKLMIGAFDPAQAVRLAETFLGWGARCLKVKVGIDLERDLARLRAVRETAGAEIPITVDANGGWDLAPARRALPQIEPFNIRVAEQPIPPGDHRALAHLRNSTTIPLMADESVWTATDAWALAQAGAVDVISVYPGKNGGILSA